MRDDPLIQRANAKPRAVSGITKPTATVMIIGVLLAFASALPAQAMSPSFNSGILTLTSSPLLPPPPHHSEEEEDGASGEGTEQKIFQTIVQTITFPFENLAAGMRESLNKLFSDTASAAMEPMGDALDQALAWLLPTDMLADLRWEAWRAMAKVAAALLPLALMITVGSAMREGVTSITGYAHAREALLNWLIGVGAAAASYLLLEKAIELSSGGASAIQQSLGQEILAGAHPGQQLLGGIVNSGLIANANPLLQLFLGFFALFTMIAIVASVTLAMLAREVLLLLLVAIAPVILLLGSMGPLRWLSGLWTKAVVISLLLGPINVLLIYLTALIATHANSASSGAGGTILGMLIGIGVISVLVAVNGTVGKMVYGAAIEVAHKALGSVVGVLQLAALATGFAIAPSAGGLLGAGRGLIPSSSVSGGGFSSSWLGAEGNRSLVGAGEASSHFGPGRSRAHPVGSVANPSAKDDMTVAMGGALAGSRNRLLRSFGQGVRLGGVARGFAPADSALRPSAPMESIDFQSEISGARDELVARFAGSESKTMARFGLSQDDTQGSIEQGIQVARSAFAAMQDLGLDAGEALLDLGYFQGGGEKGAAARFSKANAGSWAFGARSPYEHPSPLLPPRHDLSGHDVQAALNILGASVRHEGSIAATPKMIRQVALTVHQMREQHGQSIPSIIEQASRYGSRATLLDWMRDAYYNLPDRDRAAALGQALGISGAETE